MNGSLLYIGQTNDAGRRIGEHIADKDWLPEYFNTRLQRGFKTREEINAAEEVAIRVERPRYNVEGKTRPYRGVQDYRRRDQIISETPFDKWFQQMRISRYNYAYGDELY